MATATANPVIPASNLVSLVNSIIGERSGIVTIETETDPKMNKTHRETKVKNPFTKGVRRHVRRNVILGSDYEKVVNGRREKAGETADFEAGSLWNGAGRRLNRHFAYHATKGTVYLVYLPKTDEDNTVVNYESHFTDIATGRKLEDSEVTPYLPVPSDGELPWRLVSVSNVKTLTYGGNTYRFEHDVTVEAVGENINVVEV